MGERLREVSSSAVYLALVSAKLTTYKGYIITITPAVSTSAAPNCTCSSTSPITSEQ